MSLMHDFFHQFLVSLRNLGFSLFFLFEKYVGVPLSLLLV